MGRLTVAPDATRPQHRGELLAVAPAGLREDFGDRADLDGRAIGTGGLAGGGEQTEGGYAPTSAPPATVFTTAWLAIAMVMGRTYTRPA